MGIHGPVSAVHVNPIPHPGRELGEGVNVPNDRFAAFGIEFGHAIVLNIFLAGKAEFLLNGEFNGKTVAVPTSLTNDVIALHGPVPREDVFKGPSLDVMGPRSAIGSGWPLIERPRGAALTLGHGGSKSALGLPQCEDFMFQIAKIHRGWDHFVHMGALFSKKTNTKILVRCLSKSGAVGNFSARAIPYARASTDALSHMHMKSTTAVY